MTIRDFLSQDYSVIGHIEIWGHTENDRATEHHLMYDSENPRCKSGVPEEILDYPLRSIYANRDALCLHFVTDKFLYNYL